jgi:hypothetical protein
MTKSIHSATSEARKLAALRARTDHDLVVLIKRAMESGRNRLRQGGFDEAEAFYGRGAQLLPLVSALPQRELRELEFELAELRSLLDEATMAAVALAK